MEEIRITVTRISLDDFQQIKKLIVEWEWKNDIRYDLIDSSDEENPTITFYIAKDFLGEFVGIIFCMGSQIGFDQN
jgi:hypothetical protein